MNGYYRNMVGNVDVSDSRCICICIISARDLRLITSQLHRIAITWPGSGAAMTVGSKLLADRQRRNSDTAIQVWYAMRCVLLTPGVEYIVIYVSLMALVDCIHSDITILPGWKSCLWLQEHVVPNTNAKNPDQLCQFISDIAELNNPVCEWGESSVNIDRRVTPVWYHNLSAKEWYILDHPPFKNYLSDGAVKHTNSSCKCISVDMGTVDWWWTMQVTVLALLETLFIVRFSLCLGQIECQRDYVREIISERSCQSDHVRKIISETSCQRDHVR